MLEEYKSIYISRKKS